MAVSVNICTLQIGQKMQESTQLYRQAKTGPPDIAFIQHLQVFMPKNIPSEALLPLTVYAFFG
ncbi:hypothetical protein AB433_10990 [Croceicoccus naphthovorans]|uniref:Uncharacterized protein n=1 Tax=Croceicoccus naphthovorans TaxID=1348774 RepID=A0A0G3XGM9_9SPHN|nr:hypothetical protein AB433_10990 [Croceicoccus naphthovorans]